MQKNHKKFSKIYDAHVESIYRFIYIKVSSQEIAQDLTSEVFLRVWKSFQKQDLKNPKAFLYTTARHIVIDHYRTHKSFVSLDKVSDIEDSGQGIAKTEEKMELIQAGIKNLKEEYQNVIILRYVNDLSISEIAHVIDKSKGATRTLLSRALAELREQIV